MKEDMQELNNVAGWKKVSANVPLKQEDNRSRKDTTRMNNGL